MSDNPNTEPENTDPQQPSEAPSAETQNTSQADDNRVPYSRFKEVNDTLKATQTRLAELEAAEQKRRDAEMSELERAQNAAQEAKAQAEQFQAQLEAERQQRIADRRNNLVATALATAQAVDPDETVDWLTRHAADDLAAVMSEDGTPDPDQIKRLVDRAKADRPHHFRPSGPGSPSNRGGEVPQTHITEKAKAAAAAASQYGYKLDEKRLNDRIAQHEDEQALRNQGR